MEAGKAWEGGLVGPGGDNLRTSTCILALTDPSPRWSQKRELVLQ